MSIDLIAAALWLPLEPARKLVLVALCDRADFETGRCWPGREEIALRSSLTVRSVTPHLQALERDGWLRSKRGNSRAGETTMRVLNVSRILAEAEPVIKAHREAAERRRQLLGEDASRNDAEQLALGEVDVVLGEADGIDQGKLTSVLGEAASLETVREPSYEPSDQKRQRARAREAPPASTRERLMARAKGLSA